MIRRLFISVLFLVLVPALSCTRIERGDFVPEGYVSVPLDVSVLTKGEEGLEEDPESVIKNLWVIHFNGDSDESELLGEATYFEDFSTFDGSVNLVATATKSTIYLIANTFEGKSDFSLPQGYKIKELKGRSRMVTAEGDILGQDADGGRYPIFSARIDAPSIGNVSSLRCTLKRNISKVNYTVKNSTQGEKAVTISSVQLCSIPNKSFYLGELAADGDIFPVLPQESFIDYPVEPWPEGVSSYSNMAYLPINKRGTTDKSGSELSKNRYAPKGATHLVVKGTYQNSDKENIPIVYTFYLGGNMTNDYNLKGNGAYTYEFDIKSVGEVDSDSRVNDMALVDYSDSKYQLSNCYILNPIPTGDVWRKFRIPIQRAITFWGGGARILYENDDTRALKNNGGAWKAWVLASDFEINENNFKLVKAGGNAVSDPYFEVCVKPVYTGGRMGGNVIVAVGPDENTVSWSWHLWITDYDPYESVFWGDGEDKRYVYPVTGGDVNRYEGDYWTDNKDVYIMDRNLGWVGDPYDYPYDDTDHITDNLGLVYYQYGRKDPFFFDGSMYKYPEGTPEGVKCKNVPRATANQDNGVLYAIQNPLHFITTEQYPDEANAYYEWTSGHKYNPDVFDKNIVWFDHTTVLMGQNEGRKSIFDPCPPGYRIPPQNIWKDFTYNSHDERPNTNTFANETFSNGVIIPDTQYINGYEPFNKIKGLQYWPFQGKNVTIPEKVIYYPASGFWSPVGKVTHHGNLDKWGAVGSANEKWAFAWSCVGLSVRRAYSFTAQQDHLATPSNPDQARGLPVRCITDK
ncbi:MAG: DUF4906 domain-containing protein [Bacteroidales bacterium]|nr:DUF4906 domain-containing protein [Bacteroidales bacterium]